MHLPPLTNEHAATLLTVLYAQPHRHYHNVEHLIKVMRLWKELSAEGAWQHPLEAGLALAFHDASYTPDSAINEEVSCLMVDTHCKDYPCDLERVKSMIMATARHKEDFEADSDTLLVMDVDIADLGGSPQQFARNFIGVCMEYCNPLIRVSPEDFVKGQRQFLKTMLDGRKSIYRTPHFAYLEAQARYNIDNCMYDGILNAICTRQSLSVAL